MSIARRHLPLVVAVAALVGGAACGTRVKEAANLGTPGQPVTADSPGAAAGFAFGSDSGSGDQSGTAGSGTPAVPGSGAVRTPVSAPPGGRLPVSGETAARPLTAPTWVPGAAAPEHAANPSAQSPGGRSPDPAPSTAPVPAPNGAPAGRSPVTVATVGSLSGPAGVVFRPIMQGAQVWVKWVNSRGGLQGHPVEHVVYDDGFDPARHRAQVQEAVEQRNAIAFLANPEGATGRPSMAYITERRVPVIGNEGGSAWFYESPMYFPQGSTDQPNFYGMVAAASSILVPAGKTRAATFACSEADACRNVAATVSQYGPALGFEIALEARVSLAQPDFTAECLSARNAKVDVVFVAADGNSIGRIASSCARQGYRPKIATTSGVALDGMKKDPNLDGMIINSPVFPYFQTGTAATDEFHAAMRTFGKGVENGVGPATAWVAGKLLERGSRLLSEPPTRQALLQGLWTLRGDSLGGITQPITFTEGANAPRIACWFTAVIEQGEWVSPDGFQRHCREQPL